MLLYPEDLFEKLEFDKIIAQTQKHCKGQRARDILAKPRIFNQLERVNRMLDEVQEVKTMSSLGKPLSIRPYYNIDQPLFWLKKIDSVLEIESIIQIYDYVWAIYELDKEFKVPSARVNYPSIHEILLQVNFDITLIKAYQKIFNEENEIKDDASPELKLISKQIKSMERELNRSFEKQMTAFANMGYLKDSKETLRNGRRVLSVSSEHKRKIKGIIHDESATGRTVYIEPEEILYLNNNLFELEAQRRHEIRKIIKEFCNKLRPFCEEFDMWQKIIVRLDIINAKAKMASKYNGNKPELTDEIGLDLKQAYHPYLVLLHQEQDKKVIPFSVKLDKEERILVISGPNAGGKSVTMKAVGLMCLMLQSGMLIPISPDSKFGLFSHILVDIGDQQSMEDDLSTYSSRLKNMQMFLQKAGKKSLFLIDEFGSGTDPALGGAIAEAILLELKNKKCLGVITTHYSNIKMYAYENKELLNGAMEFNKEKLAPTYRLAVGKPGSSFAYEIARGVGLPDRVLKNAQKNAGIGAKELDELLNELQEEKRVYEKRLAENELEKLQLQKLINSYQTAFGDLEFKRKKLKMEKKEIKLNELNSAKAELDQMIKELKKEKRLEELEKKVEKIKVQKQEVVENITELKEEIYYNDDFDPATLKVGDFVKMRTGGETGEILSIAKKKAKISMGFMQVDVALRDLVPAKTPIELRSKSVNMETKANPLQLESKLDIRGYMPSDAIDTVQEFVDNALMSNLSTLKIVHGKGTGVLRKVILKKLKEYKDIKSITHPKDEFGGMGVTYVEF